MITMTDRQKALAKAYITYHVTASSIRQMILDYENETGDFNFKNKLDEAYDSVKVIKSSILYVYKKKNPTMHDANCFLRLRAKYIALTGEDSFIKNLMD